MPNRLKEFREQLNLTGVTAFLVTFQPHLRYLTGFSGSNGIGLVTPGALYLVTDGRYAVQVKKEVRGWKIFVTQESLFDELKRRDLLRPGWRVGFDGNSLMFQQYKQLRKTFPKVKFAPQADVIEGIAAVKDNDEIQKIRQAVAITDKVFGEILDIVKPGMRELDIAAEISYRHRRHGAETDAFEIIVASGERSALPHGQATSKKLKRGELVTLDLGCVYQGYHSDLTRTVGLGKLTAEAKKIYRIVGDAQQKAIDEARSGMKAAELDAVARDHIKQHGYEKFYRHSLGHGIGLQIHEAPRISVQSKAVLAAGNVVTIEPGIYIPGSGGVRIEDDIVITDGHCEVLTHSPKELVIL